MATDQGILLKIKNSLRIKHTALDEDVTDTIEACLADLHVCGVLDTNPADPLILNAVKLFCKAAYTDDTEKAAAYQTRYDALKSCLMMAGGYREEAGAGE